MQLGLSSTPRVGGRSLHLGRGEQAGSGDGGGRPRLKAATGTGVTSWGRNTGDAGHGVGGVERKRKRMGEG